MFAGLICGPTGVGKSEVACEIALANNFEIISADSRQLYSGFKIGTGTISDEWQEKVPHHFLGVLSPNRTYSVHQYCEDVMALVKKNKSTSYLVVGGTPLYIKGLIRAHRETRPPVPKSVKLQVQNILAEKSHQALHHQLIEWDPLVAKKINPKDIFRTVKALENYLFTGKSYLNFDFQEGVSDLFSEVPLICVDLNRKQLYAKIDARVETFFKRGWVKEVQDLLQIGAPETLPALNALGYKEITELLNGKFPELTANDLIPAIQKKTRNYAKKQITFFKNHLFEVKHCDFAQFMKILNDTEFNWNKFVRKFAETG